MKLIQLLFFILLSTHLSASDYILLNSKWQFRQGDSLVYSEKKYDAKDWRILDLLHDWSIEGEYHPTKHVSDWQSGFLPAGTGWYRKTLQWDKSYVGKKLILHLDGVYPLSEIWINGSRVGENKNGYIGQSYDITNFLTRGANVIAVRVDHSKPL
ncbi:MAG: sugar-binding domain-containing protein, partial [Bacteroidales bacterium]